MTQQTIESTTQSSTPLPDILSSSLHALFKQVQPSIVQVEIEGRGGGTGVVWQTNGLIITNNHVVGRDDARVRVRFSDGRTLDAQVVRRSPQLDLAALKVATDASPALQALPVGDSSALRIGEWVFAIGHPWGQRWVLTAGIVSALSVVRRRNGGTTQYIQSDVRLAPGNSGGPMLNADGAVVGINAMIFGGDLSVSIPSNVVTDWLKDLPRGRRILGVEIQEIEIPAAIASTLQPQRQTGLMVVGLSAQRQEQHHDLLVGDILLDVAGKAVPDVATLRQLVAQAGERIAIGLVRGGQVQQVEAATLTAENAL
jgi:serine protease Do